MATLLNKSDLPILLDLIPKNSIFSVVFVKKDGSDRLMVCRRGVKSHLNPNSQHNRPKMPEEEVTVYDMIAHGYRMFNKDTVKKIKTFGDEFYFI